MIVGIDLGTTHSLIGVFDDNGARLFHNGSGDVLTPSIVGVLDDGDVVVGRAARERALTHPESCVAAFKRFMGTQRETRLGSRTFRPEELSALVLRALLHDAELALGEKVSEAVISVPAYFSDAQRKATRNAGQLAGVRVERLINEPTAAALAYGLQQREAHTRFLVFDLGGGTFDVSILELFDGVMEVHASAGDNFLGGEDFVELLLKTALADLKVDPAGLHNVERAQLWSRCERIKCRLSNEATVTQALRVADRDVDWTITESRFETLAAPLLQRMRTPVERALRDSRTRPQDLAEIVLVGGASRMPMVSRLVARMFGRLPMRHLNPDQTVALGAACMAGMKGRHQAFEEIVMTDVCPYTLGIEISRSESGGTLQHGLFSPILERNSVIPASRVERYSPMQDYQTHLVLKAYQGESPRVANNVFLGQLEIPLPRMAKEQVPVDVRFSYDVNGLLEVEALVLPTNARHQLVIQQNPGVLSTQEIAARLLALSALKIHPREQQANLAVRGRAERLYEEHIGAVRQQIGEALVHFDSVIDSQDLRRIETAREEFERFLDSIDAAPLN